MAKKIIERFPTHSTYVEPFCGSCAVLLQKPISKNEIINDKDTAVVKIFSALREHPLELAAMIWATPYSKANREHIPINELEASCLEMAKAKQFYSGNQNTSTFSLDFGHANKSKASVWAEWHERVFPAAARLKAVQILNEDAISVIERFKDQEGALIYIDPPYVGHENEYRCAVNYDDLIQICSNARAKIVVSEFKNGADKWPGSWRREIIETVGRSRTGKHGSAKKNTEYLIFNFQEHALEVTNG